MKTVCIAITTWPIIPARAAAFEKCLTLLHEYVMASRHRIVIAATSESWNCPVASAMQLANYCRTQRISLGWRRVKNDLGSNMNAALDLGRGFDYTLLCQDDHFFTEPVDISPLCEFLDARPEFALVRFGWAMTTFIGPIEGYPLQEANIDGQYPYADEPQLRRSDETWRYAEGLEHGMSEGEMVWRMVRAKARIAAVMKPIAIHGGVPSTIEARR